MIVVIADSGPIRYLAVLNVIDILPKLYDRIILPRSVVQDMSHPHAPAETPLKGKPNLPLPGNFLKEFFPDPL